MTSLGDRRLAGVLLHPTSLPGDAYCGDFGANARSVADGYSNDWLLCHDVFKGPVFVQWFEFVIRNSRSIA